MVYYLGQKNRKMDREAAMLAGNMDGQEKMSSVGIEHTSSSFRYML
jgi:hypothetical protein